MRRITGWTARLAVASAAFVLGGAAAGEAQTPQLNIASAPMVTPVIEGDSGTLNVFIQVTTSGPSVSTVSVSWRTLAGSANGGSDYVVVSSGGPLIWTPGNTSPQNLAVQIQGDTIPEWSSILQQDEVLFVELFNPVNATIGRSRSAVTIVDNDTVQPGVQYLSAVTDSTGTNAIDGRNRLQWRVPAAPTAPTQIKVCWNTGPVNCVSPVIDTAAAACLPVAPVAMGSKQLFTHDNTSPIKVNVPAAYCYSVFTLYPAFSAERAEVEVKTFDSTPGPVKWTFTPGHYSTAAAASLVPPTVGLDGIYSVGTDGVVYAMQRGTGATSGLWPPTWNPVALGKPAHNRSPVVTFSAGAYLFVGTENGEVHAVDARSGSIVWSRAAGFPVGSQQLMPGSTGTQATPAGLFKSFGGLNDLLLVGTATGGGNTKFFALNPTTGAINGGGNPWSKDRFFGPYSQRVRQLANHAKPALVQTAQTAPDLLKELLAGVPVVAEKR